MQEVVNAILIGVVSFLVLRFLLNMRNRISGPQARAEVEAGALLLDVRSPAEYGGGSLPGATNIPVQSLGQRVGELDAERPVVVFCASGMRSARAASLLRGKGFTVHDLGSVRAW